MKKIILTVAILIGVVFACEKSLSTQSSGKTVQDSNLLSTLIPPVRKPIPLPPDLLKATSIPNIEIV